MLDGRVRANIAVFFYDYDDIQLQFVNTGNTVLGNAATAEIVGGEMELLAAVSDSLDLRIGLSVMDTEYTDYQNAPVSSPNDLGFGPFGGNTVSVADVSGNEMVRAPDYTFNIGANYSQPISDSYEFSANINWYYNDGFFWQEDNRLKEDAYDVVNAEISVSPLDYKWKVRLWGKNLTDDDYSIFTVTGQFGDLAAYAPPRTIGAGVEYSF